MFKLLTEEYTEKLVHEYSLRRIVVILWTLVLTLIVGVGALLPSYILSKARKDEVVTRGKTLDALNVGGDQLDLSGWLSRTNTKLALLAPKLDTDKPSVVFEQIVNEKISGIHLTSLIWTKTSKKSEDPTLAITGIADNRQVLVDFENKMSSSQNFSGVSLPVSNLARDKDIDFQMEFAPAKSVGNSETSS